LNDSNSFDVNSQLAAVAFMIGPKAAAAKLAHSHLLPMGGSVGNQIHGNGE
jgi:hypothetical protein